MITPTDGGPRTSAAVTIRAAEAVHLPAIGRLGALLVRTHYEFDPERFIAATPGTAHAYESFLGSGLNDPNIIVLVALRGSDVFGYTYAGVESYDYMSLRGPAGVLYDIVVDAAHRREGIGRMLLETTLATLKTRGVPRFVLSTAEKNEAAQRLFTRAGFRRTMVEMTRGASPCRLEGSATV
jgi:ribosomal protein S18 acetylase RimI-like enzyme